MIKLLSPENAHEIQVLRLLSLKTDPDVFVSTYEYELQFSNEFIGRKVNYITLAPDFGYWGYFSDNNLIGYCQLVRERLPKCDHLVYLYELYIRPEQRGKHYGTRFLTKLINKCRNNSEVQQLRLKVNEDNQTALKLYTQLQFTLYGRIENAIKRPNGTMQTELLYFLEV